MSGLQCQERLRKQLGQLPPPGMGRTKPRGTGSLVQSHTGNQFQVQSEVSWETPNSVFFPRFHTDPLCGAVRVGPRGVEVESSQPGGWFFLPHLAGPVQAAHLLFTDTQTAKDLLVKQIFTKQIFTKQNKTIFTKQKNLFCKNKWTKNQPNK